MKNLLILSVMMLSMITFAQEVKPKFDQLKDGKIAATYFHEDGTIAQQGFFLNNKRHGEWISYNKEGQKTAQAEFDNGKKTGKWFIWNGDELTEVDYQNNQIASVNTWIDKDPVASNKP
ncbi:MULTISPECIES: toxin-antitoxin system YwqK family antitoxin [Nonlabens]|uniref:Nicotinic acid mononucleotide adenyltransferase n=1 Tax=Nonlabens agnitus TaxID=870484 RepID=A0A2S9WWU6_9FLAO|nr:MULTISPECIES: nicotinic acid mononucleotide adenyltransferase [Nonlabens]KQC34495.1 nicotinic acid mononucleotide adenyltransferase [Nonlabens sp. YIK11]PRP67949.1 nicotinic acid mononucleotide adenyltransferase [Nonlabens agnitus]